MATCPNCRQEVKPDYRFCQHCGFKLWQTWNGSNLSKFFGSVEVGKNVHRLAQNKLWKIGKDLGFHSITEFVPSTTVIQSQSELIDVVWQSGNDLEFAFEIRARESNLDVLAAQDDVEKLRNLECPKKFLVNVSNKTGKAYFNEITDESIARTQVFSESQPLGHEIMLNIPSLDEISRRFGVVEPGKSVRQKTEMKLQMMGTDLGFGSYSWYEMPNLLNDGRNRFISVVWKTGNEIAVAFQVRRKRMNPHIVTSLNDRSKLYYLHSKEKYIVNVSEKTGKPYFFRITDSDNNNLGPAKSTENLIGQETSLNLEKSRAYNLDEIKLKHARAYESWTQAEDSELSKYCQEGLSVSQLAEKHQRQSGAIRSRLKKLGLLESQNVSEGIKVEKTRLVIFLVKSEKHGKICLACVDTCMDVGNRWIRPIRPGGFEEKDIVMDNGKMMGLFDVVEMKFGAPFPIKHHTENILFALGTNIRFVMKLGEDAQKNLLSEIANTQILDAVSSRDELYDEMALHLNQSLVLAGPINLFEIQCNVISGKTHPRIWIVRPNDKQRIFSITCTDLAFCKFIKSKIANLEQDDGIISSQNIAEFNGKQTYFVIGLTGDSLDENNEIRDGKYAPPGSSIQPRYWPMVVGVLTVPNCSRGD